MTLQQSVIATLTYFNMFNYGLSLSELHRYLWKYKIESVGELESAVRAMPEVEQHNGLYTLAGRGEIAELRNERYLQTERKYQKRRWIFWLLSLMPFVRAIFIVNSLAIHNARESSDIDLLIITDANRVWTARFFTTTMAKLLGVRPKPNYTKDTVCLSFYMDTTVLDMEDMVDGEDDVYQIYWLKQLVPIYDPHHTWQNIEHRNQWLESYLPNAKPVTPHPNRFIRHSALHAITKTLGKVFVLEQWFKKIQYRIMPYQLQQLSQAEHNRVVVLTDHMLKLHTNDPRPQWRDQWQQSQL